MSRRRRHHRRKRRQQIASLILIAVVVLVAGGVVLYQYQQQSKYQVTAGNSYNPGVQYREVEVEEESYRYNNRVSCILYAALNSTGVIAKAEQYGGQASADTIALVVMNEQTGEVRVIEIPGDTITEVRQYSPEGTDEGLVTTQIRNAYSYGDGGRASVQNLLEAVSSLMGEIPIRDYMITNQDSLVMLSSLVEGIEVPGDSVSNQDLKFLFQLLNKIKTLHRKDVENFLNSSEDVNSYLQSSITTSKYLSLAQKIRSLELSEENLELLPGTAGEDSQAEEFYPDSERIQERVLELFYTQTS